MEETDCVANIFDNAGNTGIIPPFKKLRTDNFNSVDQASNMDMTCTASKNAMKENAVPEAVNNTIHCNKMDTTLAEKNLADNSFSSTNDSAFLNLFATAGVKKDSGAIHACESNISKSPNIYETTYATNISHSNTPTAETKNSSVCLTTVQNIELQSSHLCSPGVHMEMTCKLPLELLHKNVNSHMQKDFHSDGDGMELTCKLPPIKTGDEIQKEGSTIDEACETDDSKPPNTYEMTYATNISQSSSLKVGKENSPACSTTIKRIELQTSDSCSPGAHMEMTCKLPSEVQNKNSNSQSHSGNSDGDGMEFTCQLPPIKIGDEIQIEGNSFDDACETHNSKSLNICETTYATNISQSNSPTVGIKMSPPSSTQIPNIELQSSNFCSPGVHMEMTCKLPLEVQNKNVNTHVQKVVNSDCDGMELTCQLPYIKLSDKTQIEEGNIYGENNLATKSAHNHHPDENMELTFWPPLVDENNVMASSDDSPLNIISTEPSASHKSGDVNVNQDIICKIFSPAKELLSRTIDTVKSDSDGFSGAIGENEMKPQTPVDANNSVIILEKATAASTDTKAPENPKQVPSELSISSTNENLMNDKEKIRIAAKNELNHDLIISSQEASLHNNTTNISLVTENDKESNLITISFANQATNDAVTEDIPDPKFAPKAIQSSAKSSLKNSCARQLPVIKTVELEDKISIFQYLFENQTIENADNDRYVSLELNDLIWQYK